MDPSESPQLHAQPVRPQANGTAGPGLAIDYATQLGDNEVALNLQVQEQLASPRRRQRFPKAKPLKSAKQILPTGVLGVGHLVRQRYREIAQLCGQDTECWRTQMEALAARLNGVIGAPMEGPLS